MRKNNDKSTLSIKASLRQPWKTLLVIGIIALISFSFSIRAFEGLIVEQEINRLGQQYHSMGRLIPTNPLEWCVQDAKELLDKSPYVKYTESLRLIQGVMDEVYTPDFGGFNPFVNKAFVKGTLIEKTHAPYTELFFGDLSGDFFRHLPMSPYLDLYTFSIRVDSVLASLPELTSENIHLRIAFIDYKGQNRHVYEEAMVGQRYFLGAQFSNNIRLMEAEMFHQRGFGMQGFATTTRLHHLTGNWRRYYWDRSFVLHPLNKTGDVFLYPICQDGLIKDPDILERTTEEIEVLKNNIHTIFLRPTKNLTANPVTAPDRMSSIFLLEGRLIDDIDEETKNNVAVIRAEFAQLRGLEVGDSLTVTMRESPFAKEYFPPDSVRGFPVRTVGDRQIEVDDEYLERNPFADAIEHNGVVYPTIHRGVHSDLGHDEFGNLEIATGYITDRETRYNQSRSESIHHWQDMETQTVTLEIVGIYGVNDDLHPSQTYLYNNVFVPNSILPGSWTQDVLYRNFSFVLESPAYQEKFLLEYEPLLNELGFEVALIDSGWEYFKTAVAPVRAGILVGIITFFVLMLIVFALSVLIYFLGRRKEYAIMRALGKVRSKAGMEISLPIMLKGLLGLLVGIIPAWFFALARAGETLADLGQVTTEDVNFVALHFIWFLVIVLSVYVIFMLLVIYGLAKLAKYPVLELLQGNLGKQASPESDSSKQTHNENEQAGLQTPTESRDATKKRKGATAKQSYTHRRLSQQQKEVGYSLRIAHGLKLIFKRTLYRKGQTSLAIIIAAGFLGALSFMPYAINRNLEQVDWLYDNTIVTGVIIIDPIAGEDARRVGPGLSTAGVQGIMELETVDGETLITSYLAVSHYDLVVIPGRVTEEELQDIISDFRRNPIGETPMITFNDKVRYEEFLGVDISIEYLEGFDDEIFYSPILDEPSIIIPPSLKEQHDLNLGDYLYLFSTREEFCPDERALFLTIDRDRKMTHKIVGIAPERVFETDRMFIPLLDMQQHDIDRHIFALWHEPFEITLNPAINRELDTVREMTSEIFAQRQQPFILVLHDEVLREAVEPLEQNIGMMSRLYPILLGLSIFIATGLTLLTMLPSVREVAIIRVFGMSKTRLLTVLLAEKMLAIILGLALGAIVSNLAFGYVNAIGLSLYFFGGVLASAIFAFIFIRMEPLRLLQVNE